MGSRPWYACARHHCSKHAHASDVAQVALSLNLAFHLVDAAPFCLFDEVDSTLDSARCQALADHIATRSSGQNICVSHRMQARALLL